MFAEKFQGMISNAQVYEDGNITIDGSDDAKGGVFAQEAIIWFKGVVPGRRPVESRILAAAQLPYGYMMNTLTGNAPLATGSMKSTLTQTAPTS